MKGRRVALHLLVSALCFPFFGCVRYHLVRRGSIPFSSIHVAAVQNFSDANRIQGILWEEICREISRCPSLRLESAAAAGAILEVHVRSLSQDPAISSPEDPARATTYRVTLEALCSLRHGCGDEVYFSAKPVSSSVDISVGPHYIDARSRAMPLLARNLSRKIRDLLMEPW
ncbi:MAG: LPS assembly lipoprotein LptE [Puniceicoccales bacterium]|jgi:hypothetical protein|nr:LPS assembly lipoprotein LptE [Puniceicoccales bacterium]